MLKNLDELIDKFAEYNIPSIDIRVLHNGREIYRRMEGYSNKEKKTPINGNEKYNVYSCSKPITVTSAMKLFENGKFELDDNISKYLPEFSNMSVSENGAVRAAKREITVRDLFTMSAGLTYNLNSENINRGKSETNGRCQTREMMKYLAKDPLAFDPGEKYNYSLCHDVLAAMVEEISGERFGEFVKKNIFEPLGMNDSTFLPNDEEISSLAEQYSFDQEKKVFNPISKKNGFRFGTEYESGGAGCVTTVDDYLKFLEGLRTGKLLKFETIALMSTNQLDEKRLANYGMGHGYGYGLGLRCELNNSGSSDFGWGGAAGSFLACDIKHGFSVFHAQHVLGSPNQHLRILIPEAIRKDLENL